MTVDPDAPRGPSELKLLLEVAVAVASSGAFISALLVYFGWLRTRVLFEHFGVPVSILNYSTADYVLRSAEVFFKPATWTALGLAGLAAIYIAASRLERPGTAPRHVRTGVRTTLAVATAVCIAVGVSALAGPVDATIGSILLCLSGALIILQHALQRIRSRPPTVVLIVGILIALTASFWSVSIYAADIGTALAQSIATGRQPRPNVTIRSTTELGIEGMDGAGCQSTRDVGECHFIYSGYQLLAYTNQRWILIRQPWSVGSPTVILPDNDSVRVELTAA